MLSSKKIQPTGRRAVCLWSNDTIVTVRGMAW